MKRITLMLLLAAFVGCDKHKDDPGSKSASPSASEAFYQALRKVSADHASRDFGDQFTKDMDSCEAAYKNWGMGGKEITRESDRSLGEAYGQFALAAANRTATHHEMYDRQIQTANAALDKARKHLDQGN